MGIPQGRTTFRTGNRDDGKQARDGKQGRTLKYPLENINKNKVMESIFRSADACKRFYCHTGIRKTPQDAPHACTHIIALLARSVAGIYPRHATRLAALFDTVEACVTGAGLSITAVGRRLVGPTTLKHKIKRADRLIGNPHLYRERTAIYGALCRRDPGPDRRAPDPRRLVGSQG